MRFPRPQDLSGQVRSPQFPFLIALLGFTLLPSISWLLIEVGGHRDLSSLIKSLMDVSTDTMIDLIGDIMDGVVVGQANTPMRTENIALAQGKRPRLILSFIVLTFHITRTMSDQQAHKATWLALHSFRN